MSGVRRLEVQFTQVEQRGLAGIGDEQPLADRQAAVQPFGLAPQARGVVAVLDGFRVAAGSSATVAPLARVSSAGSQTRSRRSLGASTLRLRRLLIGNQA